MSGAAPDGAGPASCRCGHRAEAHQPFLLDPDRSIGMSLCSVSGCGCGATWHAAAAAAAEEERAATESIVRDILRAAGMASPPFLQ